MSSWGNFEMGKIEKIHMMCWLMWVIVFDFEVYIQTCCSFIMKNQRFDLKWLSSRTFSTMFVFFQSPSFVCLSSKSPFDPMDKSPMEKPNRHLGEGFHLPKFQPPSKQIYVFQPSAHRQVDGNGPSFREEFESKWRRRKGLFRPMAFVQMGALYINSLITG